MPELWTRHEIAGYLGIAVGSVNSKIARAGDLEPVDTIRDDNGRLINRYSATQIREKWPEPNPDERRGGPRRLVSLDSRALAAAHEYERDGAPEAADHLRTHLAYIREAWRGGDQREHLSDDFEVIASAANSAAELIREQHDQQ